MTTSSLPQLLKNNPYPGRGLVLGGSADGQSAFVAYFIMGRSVNSRNRVFEVAGSALSIKAFDQGKVEDPSLIFYRPLMETKDQLILTNGDQTDTIYEGLQQGKTAQEALFTRKHEPDAPHFTPRISGVLDKKSGDMMLSILRASNEQGELCDRLFYYYPMRAGFGRFIHTYQGDENPLPSFVGEPLEVEIQGDVQSFAQTIWDSLNPDFKVALYVREMNLKTASFQAYVFNRHLGGEQNA